MIWGRSRPLPYWLTTCTPAVGQAGESVFHLAAYKMTSLTFWWEARGVRLLQKEDGFPGLLTETIFWKSTEISWWNCAHACLIKTNFWEKVDLCRAGHTYCTTAWNLPPQSSLILLIFVLFSSSVNSRVLSLHLLATFGTTCNFPLRIAAHGFDSANGNLNFQPVCRELAPQLTSFGLSQVLPYARNVSFWSPPPYYSHYSHRYNRLVLRVPFTFTWKPMQCLWFVVFRTG